MITWPLREGEREEQLRQLGEATVELLDLLQSKANASDVHTLAAALATTIEAYPEAESCYELASWHDAPQNGGALVLIPGTEVQDAATPFAACENCFRAFASTDGQRFDWPDVCSVCLDHANVSSPGKVDFNPAWQVYRKARVLYRAALTKGQ